MDPQAHASSQTEGNPTTHATRHATMHPRRIQTTFPFNRLHSSFLTASDEDNDSVGSFLPASDEGKSSDNHEHAGSCSARRGYTYPHGDHATGNSNSIDINGGYKDEMKPAFVLTNKFFFVSDELRDRFQSDAVSQEPQVPSSGAAAATAINCDDDCLDGTDEGKLNWDLDLGIDQRCNKCNLNLPANGNVANCNRDDGLPSSLRTSSSRISSLLAPSPIRTCSSAHNNKLSRLMHQKASAATIIDLTAESDDEGEDEDNANRSSNGEGTTPRTREHTTILPSRIASSPMMNRRSAKTLNSRMKAEKVEDDRSSLQVNFAEAINCIDHHDDSKRPYHSTGTQQRLGEPSTKAKRRRLATPCTPFTAMAHVSVVTPPLANDHDDNNFAGMASPDTTASFDQKVDFIVRNAPLPSLALEDIALGSLAPRESSYYPPLAFRSFQNACNSFADEMTEHLLLPEATPSHQDALNYQ